MSHWGKQRHPSEGPWGVEGRAMLGERLGSVTIDAL